MLRAYAQRLDEIWERHAEIFTLVAAEAFLDLRRGLLTGNEKDFIEAAERMAGMFPYYAEVIEQPSPERWRNMAWKSGMVLGESTPVDEHFAIELGALLRSKVSEKDLRNVPPPAATQLAEAPLSKTELSARKKGDRRINRVRELYLEHTIGDDWVGLAAIANADAAILALDLDELSNDNVRKMVTCKRRGNLRGNSAGVFPRQE